MKQAELEEAITRITQWKEIAQANEDALNGINNAYEAYKVSTEATLEENKVCPFQ
jgi:hypothetical protein